MTFGRRSSSSSLADDQLTKQQVKDFVNRLRFREFRDLIRCGRV
jgi:hypothetical protein